MNKSVQVLLVIACIYLITPAHSQSVESCRDDPNSSVCQDLLARGTETNDSILKFMQSIVDLNSETRARLIQARLLNKRVEDVILNWNLNTQSEINNGSLHASVCPEFDIESYSISADKLYHSEGVNYQILPQPDLVWEWQEMFDLLCELEGLGYPLSRRMQITFTGRVVEIKPGKNHVCGNGTWETWYIHVEIESWDVSTGWADSKDEILPTLYEKRAEAYDHYMSVGRQ